VVTGTTVDFGSGWVAFGVVVAVILAVVVLLSLRGARRPVAPEALFLFGVSLVSLVIGVASVGVGIHAVAQLVGPSPANVSFPTLPPEAFADGGPASGSAAGGVVIPSDEVSGASGSVLETLNVGGDQTNHYISVAVEAALFAVAAAACYSAAWKRAQRSSGAGLRSGYGYLVAGLAAVATLVLAPVSANEVFRAVAPGVTGAAGHAEGARGVVTFGALLAISLFILRAHLRFAASPIDGLPGGEPPDD
jgi:hypothetical protein